MSRYQRNKYWLLKLLPITFLVGVLLIILHLILIILSGSIISTPFLTIGMYLTITWLLIFVVKRNKFNNNWIPRIVIFSIILFSTEIFLKFFLKQNLGYVEANGGIFYFSPYRWHNLWDNKFEIRPASPFAEIQQQKSEYTITYHYNNLGFKGRHIYKKKQNEYRILAFGDSFTEGVGATDNFSWPFLLNNRLQKMDTNINVINLGKSGNDPVYALHTLRDTFIQMKPNMILLAINGSDISDIAVRGGLERFDNKGNLHLKSGPWWEFFYSYSPIVRRIIHSDLFGKYDKLLIDRNIGEFEISAEKLAATIIEMNKYCTTNNIQFLLILIPTQWEMETRALHNNLDKTLSILKKNKIQIIFLPELYEKNGMTPNNANQYYWKLDGHHNNLGYDLLAKCVYDNIYKREEN